MAVLVDIQQASGITDTPSDDEFRRWVAACINDQTRDYEVSLRLVDISEISALNKHYRHQDKPTNVLSFPAEFPEELNIPLLGDIVICSAVVAAEAEEQHKSLPAHWAHMTIHGTLHLLGYDHIDEKDAIEMEALETDIMQNLGFPPPYAEITVTHH